MPRYPHLRPSDEIIWNKFIEKNPDRFKKVWYDVRVGEPDMPEVEVSDVIKRAWYDLTRWQIDVLAEDDFGIYVIEVKLGANAKAIGQALAYAALFGEKRHPVKPVIPVVLTDKINPITARCAEYCKVELWEA